jgi:hypothetical protein
MHAPLNEPCPASNSDSRGRPGDQQSLDRLPHVTPPSRFQTPPNTQRLHETGYSLATGPAEMLRGVSALPGRLPAPPKATTPNLAAGPEGMSAQPPKSLARRPSLQAQCAGSGSSPAATLPFTNHAVCCMTRARKGASCPVRSGPAFSSSVSSRSRSRRTRHRQQRRGSPEPAPPRMQLPHPQ